MLQAGDLNKRITLLSLFKGRDAAGQKVEIWREHCKLWAQMRCTQNSTATGDGTIVHDTEYRFYVRRRTDITDQMRIQWGGRTFELTGPPLDWQDDTRWMTIVTKEVR